MKKLITVLLAIMMIAAMVVPTMAADGDAGATVNVVGYSADRVVAIESFDDMYCMSDYYYSPVDTAEYKIVDAADLVKFASLVNSGDSFEGKTVYLQYDIDMSSVENMDPIGKYAANPFKGTFDGQGHIIDNLTIKVDGKQSDVVNIGLFGNTVKATLKNFILADGCEISYVHENNTYTNVRMAAVVGNMRGGTTIDNIYTAASVTGGNYVGGIAGFSDPGPGEDATDESLARKITNCTQAGTIFAKTSRVGGIIGLVPATVLTISNCRNTGSVTTDGTDANWHAAGGFIGDCWGGLSLVIDGCINNGAVKGGSAGGFIGRIQMNVSITNSLNYGTTDASVVGGLVAKINNNGEVTNTGSEDKTQGDTPETDATLSTLPTVEADYPTAAEIEAAKNSNKKTEEPGGDTTQPGDTTTPGTDSTTTTAPADNNETNAPETNAPATTPAPVEEEGGCASVVGCASVALLALAAVAPMVIRKKKED